jgi:hypothetical protein
MTTISNPAEKAYLLQAVILSEPDPELVEGEGESKDLRLLFLVSWSLRSQNTET